MTRRFDIGPVVLAIGALLLLVGLFLPWYDGVDLDYTAWRAFEITDLLLAVLAVAGLVAAAGLLTSALDFIDQRFLPWIAGAALLLVLNVILGPRFADLPLATGAWLGFGGALVMVLGAVLSISRISFAVNVEGRDRRQRVAAVDNRPPPTETGAPVARSSTSLLHPRPVEPTEPDVPTEPEDPEAGEKA